MDGSGLDGSGDDTSDGELSSALVASASFGVPVWAFAGSEVVSFCFFCHFFGLAGVSGFVASWFADSDDDVAPDSDVDPGSAPATPAPAIIAADTPTVTRPAPIHTVSRSTRTPHRCLLDSTGQ